RDLTRTVVQSEALVALWSAGVDRDLMAVIDERSDAVRASIDRAGEPAEAVHSLWHALVSIDRARRESGDRVATQHGTVAQLNRSDGGVPKVAIDSGEVDRHGVVG